MQRIGLVAACAAVVAAACGWQLRTGDGGDVMGCTAIGCVNSVTFDVHGVGLAPGRGRLVAEVCFDDRCEDVRYTQQPGGAARWDNERVEVFVTADAVSMMLQLPAGSYDTTTVHDASLVLRVPGEPPVAVQRQVKLERSQPNGENCPPVCWHAGVEHTV